jgi:hypothetical protein
MAKMASHEMTETTNNANESSRQQSDSTASPEQKDTLTFADINEIPAEEYPTGLRLAAIVLSLMLVMFLISLDNVGSPFTDLPFYALPRH